MYTRTIAKRLNNLLPYFPVIMLVGPRHVGKSTLLSNFIPNQTHKVTFDDLKERYKALNNPEDFLQNHPTPLLINEIQHVPNLINHIKNRITQNKNQKGLYLLTCSPSSPIIQKTVNLLGGQIAILNMLGLSQYESQHIPSSPVFLPNDSYIGYIKNNQKQPKSIEAFYTNIWNGSFPQHWEQKCINRNDFYHDFIKSFVFNDVREQCKISSIPVFNKFLKELALCIGQSLNYSSLAKKVGVTDKTIQHWIEILKTIGIVYLLPPINVKDNSFLVRSPKLYFLDTGLCSYLAEYKTPKALYEGSFSYPILENYALSEILKSYWHNTKDLNISFYKDKTKHNINFILKNKNTIYPITVKNSIELTKQYVKEFKILKKLNYDIKNNIVLSLNPNLCYLDDRTLSIPVWFI